ncbi:MAG: helix-turn-helix domain-containing protein [Bacteroidota bacterium]
MPPLLSVSEAAERLGVHIGTVRRWTDEGILPVSRTPGGHRRIPAEGVERLRRERLDEAEPTVEVGHVSTSADVGLAHEAWAEHAVVHTRYRVRANADATWNQAFEGGDRSHRRESGRQLMGLLLRHVADQGDPEARRAEARRIAWGYAIDMKDRGLRLPDALRATLFFRDVLTESTAFTPRFETVEDADPIALMRKVNEFMNEIQITIAEAYDDPDA